MGPFYKGFHVGEELLQSSCKAAATACALQCCVRGEVEGRHGLVTVMFPTHRKVLGFCGVNGGPLRRP